MQISVKKLIAILEIVVIFVGLPLLYKFDFIPVHKSIPLLSVFLIYLFVLLYNKSFNRKIFGFNFFKNWKVILVRFLVISVIFLIIVFVFRPESLFNIIKQRPFIWIMIMIFYPLWSAYPQELIYRAYFFYRFKFLIKNEIIFIVFNAVLFSFSHIIFNNWIALSFTFIASILFSFTYLKSNSLMVVFIEHALYGNMIFTIGLGEYFYLPL